MHMADQKVHAFHKSFRNYFHYVRNSKSKCRCREAFSRRANTSNSFFKGFYGVAHWSQRPEQPPNAMSHLYVDLEESNIII